jgi:NADH-quinone oxidoreductase subunit E
MSRSRQFNKVCEILERYSYDSTKLIPILQAVQEEYRYLPEEVLTFVATSLNLSPARVYGVATFYSHFALQAKGKYLIRVCDGTPVT